MLVWRPICSFVHVIGDIQLAGQLMDLDLESILSVLEHSLVIVAGNKRDRDGRGSEAASATHSVEICICVEGAVVVDDDIDPGDVHATREHVGSDHDILLEILDLLEMPCACLLVHLGMNRNGWKVDALQEPVELLGTDHGLDKDADLVEFQVV